MSFEEQVKEAAEHAVVDFVRKGGWLVLPLRERITIPAEWMQEAWKRVDIEKIRDQLTDRLESEIVDRIIIQIANEITLDLKQILEIKERREMLRALMRGIIIDAMSND